jgi:hypothetical protein
MATVIVIQLLVVEQLNLWVIHSAESPNEERIFI